MTEHILIVDFGAQYTQLTARRARENGVYCEILPCTVDGAAVRDFAPRGIILSGGPASTTATGSPRAPAAAFELGVPILGICYGEQTICAQLGGKVEIADHREYGRAFIDVVADCRLFEGVFAVGDVRANSVKRVSAAVGEGSMALRFAQQYLGHEPTRGDRAVRLDTTVSSGLSS